MGPPTVVLRAPSQALVSGFQFQVSTFHFFTPPLSLTAFQSIIYGNAHPPGTQLLIAEFQSQVDGWQM
jgi:hypothetical protein